MLKTFSRVRRRLRGADPGLPIQGGEELASFSSRAEVFDSRRRRIGLVAYALLLVFWMACVFVLRIHWVSTYSSSSITQAKQTSDRLLNVFQTSFYFHYDEEFRPAFQDYLRANTEVTRLLIVGGNGPTPQVLFDSKDLARSKAEPAPLPGLLTKDGVNLSGASASLIEDPDGVGVLVPVSQHAIYYVFSTAPVTARALWAFALGCIILAIFFTLTEVLRISLFVKTAAVVQDRMRFYSLRSRLMAAIVLMHVVTGSILYLSQSTTQEREQKKRIIQDSVLLADLSKDNVINLFTVAFYFQYKERFLPQIRKIIASKPGLLGLRIISKKSSQILFDSFEAEAGRDTGPGAAERKATYSSEVLSTLARENKYWSMVDEASSDPKAMVLTTYKNDDGEDFFYVEYLFSLQRLREEVDAVQRRILIDLLPGMVLGILFALLFSHFITEPVRQLTDITKAITQGNYDLVPDSKRADELGDLIRSFGNMVRELKRKTELKKYLSNQSYRRLVESGGDGSGFVGGARVRATVLFCDIRNFVSVCESMEAEEVTALLNEYFSNMVDVIYRHKGEVDKFIGDAILAVFYEEEEQRQSDNTALHAMYCAMEMREKLGDFNAKRTKQGKPTIEIGIGLNWGEIISGPIGSPDRMDFTVIGDVVNLASRIEKLSKAGKHTRIVFSPSVENLVRGFLDYEEMAREKIQGKEEMISVYELVKIKDVSELLVNLGNPDPALKKHCIDLLGYSRNVNALTHIYHKLSDSSEAVRISAVTAITRLSPRNHPESVEILFDQLGRETSQRVVSTILISLGRLCSTSRILELSAYLQNPDERIVANAIEAMGATDDAKVVDLLIPYVGSRSNRVKANAAMVLFARGRVEVLDTLKPMLLHSDAMMRASAAFALGELTLMASVEHVAQTLKKDTRRAKHFLAELQSCVPMLVSLLKDPDLIVKRQAIVALGKIKDKSAVLPLIDNLSMETDSKEIIQEIAEALRSIGSHRLVQDVIRQLG